MENKSTVSMTSADEQKEVAKEQKKADEQQVKKHTRSIHAKRTSTGTRNKRAPPTTQHSIGTKRTHVEACKGECEKSSPQENARLPRDYVSKLLTQIGEEKPVLSREEVEQLAVEIEVTEITMSMLVDQARTNGFSPTINLIGQWGLRKKDQKQIMRHAETFAVKIGYSPPSDFAKPSDKTFTHFLSFLLHFLDGKPHIKTNHPDMRQQFHESLRDNGYSMVKSRLKSVSSEMNLPFHAGMLCWLTTLVNVKSQHAKRRITEVLETLKEDFNCIENKCMSIAKQLEELPFPNPLNHEVEKNDAVDEQIPFYTQTIHNIRQKISSIQNEIAASSILSQSDIWKVAQRTYTLISVRKMLNEDCEAYAMGADVGH